MWRSILILLIFTILGFILGIIGWVNWGWLMGFNMFAGMLLAGFIISFILIFFIKSLSTVDVFLPIPISIIWCAILLPLKVSTDLISPATMILSGFLLSYSLWMYKQKELSKGWIAIPVLVFLYEMTPITFPGPFDNAFAAAGSSGNAILLSIAALRKKPLLSLLQESQPTQGEKTVSPVDYDTTIDGKLTSSEVQLADTHLPHVLEIDSSDGSRSSEIQPNDLSLQEEVKSLAADVFKMTLKKPKIKQAIIDKSKAIASTFKKSGL